MIDKANGEPTNGGSVKPSKKAKCVCGQTIVNEKENSLEMPPKGAIEAHLLEGEENFFTIALEPDREEERE